MDTHITKDEVLQNLPDGKSFNIRPANYSEATSRLLGEAGATSEELVATVEWLASLVDEVMGLAQNLYRPKYS
jgi:hypothetical protein